MQQQAEAGAEGLLVGDLIHGGVLGCSETESLAEAADRLVRHRIHALVVDIEAPGGELRVLADTDLLEALASGMDPEQTLVGAVAATEKVTISADEPLAAAAQLMAEHQVTHLLAIEPGSGRPIGVLSSLDVARAVRSRATPPSGGLSMLVAHDGRSGGDDAAALAATLAAGGQASALAAIAVPLPPKLVGDPPLRARGGSPNLGALCDDLHEQADALLERRARPPLEGLRYEPRVLIDESPARALTNLCELERPDLVVAGSTHRGRIGRLLTGTTSERLLNGSPCPVALAPAGYAAQAPERFASVGVGFDGSEDSERALVFAAAMAQRHRAPLKVLAVVERALVGELRVVEQGLNALSGQGLTDVAAERLTEAAEAALERCPSGLNADIEVAHGDPAAVLLDHSKRSIELLVVGSRGYGPLRRTLLGSTSTEVTRGAACPVIVCARG